MERKMIESIEDLELKDIFSEEDSKIFIEKLNNKLKEKLELSLEDMKLALNNSVKDNAEEICLDLPNIVPYGDYEKLLENNDDMATFLKEETAKDENWILASLEEDRKTNLIKFSFYNKSVDDGASFSGFVFVSKSGKIRHAFSQS